MLLGDTEAIQDYHYGATSYLAYTDRRGMDKSRGVVEGAYVSLSTSHHCEQFSQL